MSRLDQIRRMSDDDLILLRCNPYTGADCKEGITQYFKEEGEL